MSKRKPKFPVGTRVEDRDSGEQGVVVHVFQGDPGAQLSFASAVSVMMVLPCRSTVCAVYASRAPAHRPGRRGD